MTNEHHIAEASKTIDHIREAAKKVEQDHVADGGKMVYGRWVVLMHEAGSDLDIYGCEKCRRAVSIVKPDWHYCPNCGARMDGE